MLRRHTDLVIKTSHLHKPGFGPVCFFSGSRYAPGMKTIPLILAVSLLLLTGCQDSTKPAGNSTRSTPASAPADYLNNMVSAEKRAARTVDLAAVNKAIEAFFVQEGHFPKDLLELVEMGYLRVLPTLPDGASWQYDPKTGIVSMEKRTNKTGAASP
jgi:hypothetical protein